MYSYRKKESVYSGKLHVHIAANLTQQSREM